MKRRAFLAAVLTAFAFPASAEYMTEAERRAQLTRLAERSQEREAPPAQGRNASPTDGQGGRFADEDPGTVIIETGRRLLHFVVGEGRTASWPIAVGREGAQWKGVTRVTHKRKNPEWRPTPNMRRRDPSLPVVVKPGPRNPLGVRAIYLEQGYLRIHGTNDPKSIGKAASSGCFRMHNEDVVQLYEMVEPGAKVIVLK